MKPSRPTSSEGRKGADLGARDEPTRQLCLLAEAAMGGPLNGGDYWAGLPGEEGRETLARYAASLSVGSECFCCGARLLEPPLGPDSEDSSEILLACPACGAEVAEVRDAAADEASRNAA